MEPVKLPAGYRLPKGTTMADVRRLDQELLASEGLKVQGVEGKVNPEGGPRKGKKRKASGFRRSVPSAREIRTRPGRLALLDRQGSFHARFAVAGDGAEELIGTRFECRGHRL